jgi:hypothetical protein
MRAGVLAGFMLAAGAVVPAVAGAAEYDCAPVRVCRSLACADAAAGDGFRLVAMAGGPAMLTAPGGERVVLAARVAAGARTVAFEGTNAAGRRELVHLDPATGAFRHTRDAGRRNAPVWTGRCAAVR